MSSFKELVADNVVNHSAPPGTLNGPDSMVYFIQGILRTGFPDLKVEILEQVAERDLVTTRKKIIATHTGTIMGIPPSHKKVVINVIDIIRLENNKYAEHWGVSNFSDVIAEITVS
jgi:predicted ester cyclase